jgi:hypothetical protein
MTGFDPGRWLSAAMLIMFGLIVLAGRPRSPAWRRRLRGAAIALFCLATIAVLFEIARWAAAGR